MGIPKTYKQIMRLIRAALAATVGLIVIAFQTAPGPFVLCRARCPMPGSGDMVEMMCVCGPSLGGVVECVVEEIGCCATAAERTPEPQGGCSLADVACLPADACNTDTDGCPLDENGCPFGWDECWICLPGRVLAERIPSIAERPDRDPTTPNSSSSEQLQFANALRRSSHDHRPTEPILSESGRDICIRVCSFLI
jgi:hypothetical protein